MPERLATPTLDQIASFSSLLRAFGKARRAKRGKGGEPVFFRDLEENLLTLGRELADGAWRPDPYRYFVLWSGKERVVAEASFRDRVVHHALIGALEPVWEPTFAAQSYACRKGKGSHLAVREAHQRCREFRYALRLDVRRYFDHVDHGVLLDLLGKRLDGEVLGLCRAVLAGTPGNGHPMLSVQRPGVGIPIGNLTSQFWANVYLDDVDRALGAMTSPRQVFRYMDDFLVYADSKALLWDCLEAATHQLHSALGLEVKPSATRVAPVHAGIGWLGFQLFPGMIRLDPATRARFARKLAAGVGAAAAQETATDQQVNSARSLCAHVAQADARQLARSILWRAGA